MLISSGQPNSEQTKIICLNLISFWISVKAANSFVVVIYWSQHKKHFIFSFTLKPDGIWFWCVKVRNFSVIQSTDDVIGWSLYSLSIQMMQVSIGYQFGAYWFLFSRFFCIFFIDSHPITQFKVFCFPSNCR